MASNRCAVLRFVDTAISLAMYIGPTKFRVDPGFYNVKVGRRKI